MTNFLAISMEVSQICEHLSHRTGRPVSDVEASNWLRSEGFVLYGGKWIGDQQSQRKLQDLTQQLSSQPRQ